ncbi:YjhG/YagF family D-xylonate dehydratase [Bythopirellula goksoeyrii]|uniref:Dihydroxy-acid dehydratase n=1 Tax=Bythopirellula goksoeyrii TaxID=1400387 RepID=A0A5B9Q9P1_9BACT|nr:YjhG/YagF family D-xylonate dehydratase [Bythopirellula goksoeyrii]QEG34142.1 Dihydroxy-acid dehydratase [Bythopirellula goksoeyrii]
MAADNPFETDDPSIYDVQTTAAGPSGTLPFTESMLLDRPSGDLFGWSQDAGMGWDPALLGRDEFLVLSTMGGLRSPDGKPIALGYHTGHWEVGLLVEAAAREIKHLDGVPFAAFCSDPCDGRTQGTSGMFDSLPYRNDAAIVLRRLIRSLPTRKGLIGVATCDKGHPAMMMALAGCGDLPSVLVPGGVTLPPTQGEDAAKIQSIGARFSHGMLTLREAAELGCRACATPGGGCQFLGTAATSQVVGEAIGLSVPHSALAPSGQPIWLDLARRSAQAVVQQSKHGVRLRDILTDSAIHNAMVVHAAFGGSTNLLLHVPAVAHAAGLRRPSVADWIEVNRQTPRLVSALPNGPIDHPTVRVFLAGGVPEVMLHLRELGLLKLDVLTAGGISLAESLDAWASSERRAKLRQHLRDRDGVDPDEVIFPPAAAVSRKIPRTLVFPIGNIAPEGSVVKATSIDPSLIVEGHYLHTGPARVFTSETAAIAAIKGKGERSIKAGDVLVLAGCGPSGTGMEETYQLTAALKYLEWGKHVPIITDARFSGVSTGACLGHVGPEALADGPIGKLLDDDLIEIAIDLDNGTGSVNLIGHRDQVHDASWGLLQLASRQQRDDLGAAEGLPTDTRLWSALQRLSGGTWGGCVYDSEAILAKLATIP